MSEIRYKVLNGEAVSPYRDYKYQIGKWYHAPKIGQMGVNKCRIGLYAGAIESLLYCGLHGTARAWRCEVKGSQSGELPLKECWEYLRVIEPIKETEVRQLAREAHERLGYNLEECLYPINPRKVVRAQPEPTDNEIELLHEWASASAFLMDLGFRDIFMENISVLPIVWVKACDSAWVGLGRVLDVIVASICNSVSSYVGSLFFPSVHKWKNIDHEPGEYPFASGAKLWRRGLVPSFDGEKWRLHAGPIMQIVWTEDT